MHFDSLTKENTPSARHRWLGVTLGLACSVTVSTTSILAMGGGSSQPWHQMPMAEGAYHHATLPAAAVFHPTPTQKLIQPLANASSSQAHNGKTGVNWHNLSGLATQKRGTRNNTFTAPLPGSRDLDLASAAANVFADNLGGFRELTILVGGVRQVVTLGSKLTGGEAVAAEQVLSGGRQTIKLSADGEATGGAVILNSSLISAIDTALGGSINTLTIARGVEVVDSIGLLSLTGNLVNSGSWLTASTVPHSTDTISATSIINSAGAVIGSYQGSGSSLFAAYPVLSAQTAVINSGTIGSAGNLTISAPAVSNLTAWGNSSASISARQNVDINATNLTNSGVIAALTGNVNLASTGSLAVSNSGGSINAPQGNINLTTANSQLTVTGGELLSRQVNLIAQAGDIDVNAGTISGTINASGDNVHIVTVSGQTLGNIDTSGDPQFVSTTGSITVNGTIAQTNGADLAIIAAGNIVSSAGAKLDTSTTSSGNGGNLTLIAGANVTGDDTLATVTNSAAAGHGSTSGGIINLAGGSGGKGALAQITTAGSGAAGNGGYVEMVAFAGTAKSSGTISIPNKLTVDAAGSGTGSAGDITLIAGATKGVAISTGALSGNNISLGTDTPSANAGQAAGVVFTSGTSNLGQAGFAGSATASAATINTGMLTAATALTINTGSRAGSPHVPINFAAAQLAVSGSTKSASAYLADLSGLPLTVTGVGLGQTGTFVLNVPPNATTGANGGAITITGPVSAGTIKLAATGSKSLVQIQNVVTGKTVSISTPGAISTSGAGEIVATTTTLNGASVDAATNTTNLTATAAKGNLTVTQGATTLNLTARVLTAGSKLTVDSQGQINLKKLVNVGASGLVTLDAQGASSGINLTGAVTAGTVSLTSGTAGIISTNGSLVNAGVINLSTTGDIGKSTQALQLNNNLAIGLGNSLTLNVGTGQSAFVRDRGTTDLTLDAKANTTGKFLTITSSASALNVVEAPFDTVALKDTSTAGAITLNSNSDNTVLLGTGKGTFNVTSVGDIGMNFSSAGIQATSIRLVSTTGNIGQTGDLDANTPLFVTQATRGNVSVTDTASGNISAKDTSPAAYDFIATGNNANVLLDSPIAAANILVRAQGTNSNITNSFALGKAANDTGTTISLTPTGNLNVNGTLTSDYMILGGNKFTGDPILLGTVNLNKALTADHSINVFVDQSSGININAPVKANAMRFVTSTAGANIVLNASLTTKVDREGDGTILTVQANNADIVNKQGIVLRASDMNLTGINIGSAKGPVVTVSSFINLNGASGAAYINNTGNMELITANPVTAGNITINNKGNLFFDGSITANLLNLNTSGIMFVGQLGEIPLSNLTGTSSLTLSAGSSMIVSGTLGGPNITATTTAFVLNGVSLKAANDLTISNAKGDLLVDGVLSGPTITISCAGQLSTGSTLDAFLSTISANQLELTGGKAVDNLAGLSGTNVVVTTSTFTNDGPGTLGATTSLTVANPGGNLNLVGAAGTIVPPAGGSLTLSAGKSILAGTRTNPVITAAQLAQVHSLTIAAGGIFTGPFSSFTAVPDAKGNGGIINVSVASLNYNGAPLPPISFNLTANGSTAAGGVVVLQLSNPQAGVSIGNGIGQFDIDASGSNGGTVLVGSAGNLTVDMGSLKSNSAPNGSGSNVTLVAGKNLLVTGSIDTHNGASGSYGNIVLQSGSKDVFTIGGGTSTLNGIVGLTGGLGQGVLGQNVTLVNGAGVAVNSGFTVFSAANLLLKASGSPGGISIGGTISSGGTADLIASGKGTITESGATSLLSAQTLSLVTDGGNVGLSPTSAFVFSAASVSANTGKNGSVFLQNNTGMATITATSVGGAFDYAGNDSVATNTDALSVGNISAASGAITIASNAQALNVLPGSTITATNGNITLQNIFLAGLSSPLISVGNNSTIHASASAKNNTKAGNVFIVLGPVPPSSALTAGVVPAANPTIKVSGSGQVTFGTTTNPNSTITAATSDTLSGLGRTLAFNTGTNKASQIVLGNSVIVTADPPHPSQKLDQGAMLIAPDRQTMIETPFGQIRVSKGAVALVISSHKGLTVFDLHDRRDQSICVDQNGKQSTTLTPGRSVTFYRDHVGSFEQVNPAELVEYRKVASKEVGDKQRLFMCEFEILSMIRSLAPLKDMFVSNDPAMRKTAGSMLKTAAILSQLSDGVPYQRHTSGEGQLAAYQTGTQQ